MVSPTMVIHTGGSLDTNAVQRTDAKENNWVRSLICVLPHRVEENGVSCIVMKCVVYALTRDGNGVSCLVMKCVVYVLTPDGQPGH